MTAKRPTVQLEDTLRQFRVHAIKLRSRGASYVKVTTQTCELECAFGKDDDDEDGEKPDKTPTIGFAMSAEPDGCAEMDE